MGIPSKFMGSFSTILFAVPGGLSGAARTLDIGCTFDSYVESSTPTEADTRALAADFMAVAEDFDHSVRALADDR
jgi:hypothetical protein